MSLPNGIESKLTTSNGVANITHSTGVIYRKMSAVMREIGSIGKDQKNQAQGFKFRGIDQFVNALYPALTKHGVFMAPRLTRYDTHLQEVTRSSGKSGVDKHVTIEISYAFYAEDGSSVVVGPIPAEGLDSGDKATNKALSAALKYALIQTFSIPTEDMAEADSESPTIETAPIKVLAKTEAAPADDLVSKRKHVLSKAQVAVAKKATSKEEILSLLGSKAGNVTDAVNGLNEAQLNTLLTRLEEKLNVK